MLLSYWSLITAVWQRLYVWVCLIPNIYLGRKTGLIMNSSVSLRESISLFAKLFYYNKNIQRINILLTIRSLRNQTSFSGGRKVRTSPIYINNFCSKTHILVYLFRSLGDPCSTFLILFLGNKCLNLTIINKDKLRHATCVSYKAWLLYKKILQISCNYYLW